MEIEFNYHGKLAELTGKNSELLSVNSSRAEDLIQELILQKPMLKESSFQIAQKNKILNPNDAVAEFSIDVFPPFSGG